MPIVISAEETPEKTRRQGQSSSLGVLAAFVSDVRERATRRVPPVVRSRLA